MTIFVPLLCDFFGDLTVLTNLNSAIDIDMKANFFLWIFLQDVMRHNIKVILHHVPKTQRIADLKQNIIDRSQINVLNSMLTHMLKDASVFHFSINGTISAWS